MEKQRGNIRSSFEDKPVLSGIELLAMVAQMIEKNLTELEAGKLQFGFDNGEAYTLEIRLILNKIDRPIFSGS